MKTTFTKWTQLFLCLLILGAHELTAKAQVLADFDEKSRDVFGELVSWEAVVKHSEDPIPRFIHQIWFGDPARKPLVQRKFQEYAEKMGFQYRLYSEKDLDDPALGIDDAKREMIATLLSRRDYWSAADILRYTVLNAFGGMYCDCDFAPPVHQGKYIDLFAVFPSKGCFFITEWHGRNIGRAGLFLGNNLIGASKGHPVTAHLHKHIVSGIQSWRSQGHNHDAAYCTGPFLLTKILNGPVPVLPIYFVQSLGMVDYDLESTLRRTS